MAQFRLGVVLFLFLTGFISLSYEAAGKNQNASVSAVDFMIPARAGADLELTPDLFVHTTASFFALPDQSYTIEGGVGFYY